MIPIAAATFVLCATIILGIYWAVDRPTRG